MLNSEAMLPDGARDLLPIDLLRQDRIKQILLGTFRSWGYQPVLPPALESLEALEKGRPSFLKECFKVIDKEGKLLALRPDMTLPIARLAATRLANVERPLRLCYTASVFRSSGRQADERREIYHAGIELIGAHKSTIAHSQEAIDRGNLECLSILLETLEKLNLTDCQIVLTHTDLWRYAGEIFHRVEEQLDTDLASELDDLLKRGDFVEYQQALIRAEERCKRSLECSASVGELDGIFDNSSSESPLNYLRKACYELTGEPEKVLSYLDADSALHAELSCILGLEKLQGSNKFLIDFTLRPDRDFYTGLYFEVVLPGKGIALGTGGRYNNLISCFGHSEPAIGFSLNLDAILNAARDKILPDHPEDGKKLSIPFGNDPLEALSKAKLARIEARTSVTLE